jgi:hypothetical protein
MVEVDERIACPEFLLQLLPRNGFSGPLEQHGQNLKGLILELDPQTVFP